jgi:hypothetical protein
MRSANGSQRGFLPEHLISDPALCMHLPADIQRDILM